MNSSMTHIKRAGAPLRVYAGLIVCIAMVATGCRGSLSSQPPVHLNPNMDNVTYIEAQEPSSFWADGRGMRPQVPGTVAIGSLDIDDHLHRGIVGDAWALTLPRVVERDARTRDGRVGLDAVLDRGQDRYEIFCTPCHGDAGLEDGGIIPRRGLDSGSWAWAVPSLHDERQRGYPLGKLYDIIANGINTMPGYAAQIPVHDRWAIAAYVRALQISQGIPRDRLPADLTLRHGGNQ